MLSRARQLLFVTAVSALCGAAGALVLALLAAPLDVESTALVHRQPIVSFDYAQNP